MSDLENKIAQARSLANGKATIRDIEYKIDETFEKMYSRYDHNLDHYNHSAWNLEFDLYNGKHFKYRPTRNHYNGFEPKEYWRTFILAN